jgi:hypothetical protein
MGIPQGKSLRQGLSGFKSLDFDVNHDRQFTPLVQNTNRQF